LNVSERNVGARDGCDARSPVGLKDVAIDHDGAFPERFEIDHGAEGAADEALDFVSAPALAAFGDFTRRTCGCGARQHGILGGDPAFAGIAQKRRNAGFDAGGAEYVGVAGFDEDGTFGGF
jgi:hypothetical protein